VKARSLPAPRCSWPWIGGHNHPAWATPSHPPGREARIGQTSAMWDLLTSRATGVAVLDAQADFQRARRRYAIARFGRWLMRQREGSRPLTLAAATVPLGGPARLEMVPLRRIVGTLEPTRHFDACFRPASEVVRDRWERIALARRTGIGLPPIALRQQSDGYFVIDGRHRVSVARAVGDSDIEAWVVGTRSWSSDASEYSSPARRVRIASRWRAGSRALNHPPPSAAAGQAVGIPTETPPSGPAIRSWRIARSLRTP
jgi:hypothetical protein